jgi:hypothetical protein
MYVCMYIDPSPHRHIRFKTRLIGAVQYRTKLAFFLRTVVDESFGEALNRGLSDENPRHGMYKWSGLAHEIDDGDKPDEADRTRLVGHIIIGSALNQKQYTTIHPLVTHTLFINVPHPIAAHTYYY